MLLHAHALPRTAQRVKPITGSSWFYSYEQLRPDTWEATDYANPCWTTTEGGLQFGIEWGNPQRRRLASYTPYKTYEVMRGRIPTEWVGVERSGYLLDEGFLPLRIAYRRSDAVLRMVMPGNVGYLYNHLAGWPQTHYFGIAPRLQFILDIDTTAPQSMGFNHNYQILQKHIPRMLRHGPHLSWDTRYSVEAYEDIQALSQSLDLLGNARWNSDERLQDWVSEHVIIEPPVRDLVVYTYPFGPIPLNVLQSWHQPGLFDTSQPAPLAPTRRAQALPESTIHDILQLQSTDLHLSYAITQGRIDANPLVQTMQNRFGAYLPLLPTEDLTAVQGILFSLFYQLRRHPQESYVATFHLTCNDEVLIRFGGLDAPSADYVEYYADLHDVTQAWFGVVQAPNVDFRLE